MSKTLYNIIETLAWDKMDLLPCIVQDYTTNQILMLAYMNKEALYQTVQTNNAHYFSRSKQRIWKKGETSGHIQIVQEIFFDCDRDAILLKVQQEGVACHTGNITCFFNKITQINQETTIHQDSTKQESIKYSLMKYDVMDTLYHTILDKQHDDPKLSYTASLFDSGDNTIAKKVIEESGEFCLAFKDRDLQQVIYECADLFYHVLIALAKTQIHPDRIYQELQRRMGISGIEEKRNRNKK
ncbi:bifunctional phosphoribosyl-AMP cyclohydrolase/phosphoribosyl-ATP diphosphatase HisIE [Helicobacter aurati]|uniref:Histidine biosynthesis bifunctional protein HisIE n=2 Tax=Helicobacter aurati TaxID=137778 RepID=A0A3D8J7S0_9HELI|nr:bifunctional phosphoribosyl-AMP cyclohydrolase/phosphoribosyl-ATP diphosphatase HisIE [Helicobacter aurati]RDU73478.1 bifunctional phosphoribosyl-AMP cyclohydrolase/phosphoribosyl-ATP diphosphatase HisIE [Helicobacter aurati]